MAAPEIDPGQGLLFDVSPVISRQTTSPGSETGTKSKRARRKDPRELIGRTVWKAYTSKTRVQCSDCVLAAKASWETGEPLERSIGSARWVATTLLKVERLRSLIDGRYTDVLREERLYLCSLHADERGHSNAKGKRS